MSAVHDHRCHGTSLQRWRRWPVALGIAVTLIATLLSGWTGAAQPASAAQHGNYLNINGFIAGNYLSSDGRSYVYCIEPGADEPYGDQKAPVRMTTLPAYEGHLGNVSTQWNGEIWDTPVTGQTLREMNYVMWTHGRTSNAEKAATVQMAVWMLRRGPGTSPWLDHHIAWIKSNGYGWLITDANTLVNEARSSATTAPTPDPAPLKMLGVEYAANGAGTAVAKGSVEYPDHTTGLSIEGGSFDGAGAQFPVSGTAAGSAGWRASLHPDGWQRRHDVTISAEWSRDVVSWPAEVVVHPPAVQSQQYLGAGISPVAQTQRRDLDPVTTTIDTQFEPRLTTEVPDVFVPHGGTFADTVMIDVADGATPWATREGANGETEFAPIVADGVLYGPFAHQPRPGDRIPDRAPVVVRTQLEADRGPGAYPVTSDIRAEESGYYAWVWSIREEAQRDEIRHAGLLPSDYEFTDAFGAEQEGQIVPTRLRWSTSLLEHELNLDRMELTDRITPTLHDGAWLRDGEGKRIPVELRLTVYQTNERPQQQREVPRDATEIARSSVTISTPGEAVESERIPIPWDTRGWVSVRACLHAEDQPEDVRGRVEEWCDDFGVPEESAPVVLPQVRTKAQPDAVIEETISDTAIVTGPVPNSSSIGFTFYLQPESGDPKFDENWKRVRDEDGAIVRWTEKELGMLSAEGRCLAQPVATTERVTVETEGAIESPEVRAKSTGTGYWVEDLDTEHPDTGERVELHRGECGLANERTIIHAPEPRPGPKSPVLETTAPARPKLVQTGAGTGIVGAIGALVILGAGALLVSARRKSGGAPQLES